MAQNFKAEQLKKSRVKQAYNNTTVQLDPELDQFGLKRENIELFLRGFKYEKKIGGYFLKKRHFCKNFNVSEPVP